MCIDVYTDIAVILAFNAYNNIELSRKAEAREARQVAHGGRRA